MNRRDFIKTGAGAFFIASAGRVLGVALAVASCASAVGIDLRTARVVCCDTNSPTCRLASEELEKHLALVAGKRTPSPDGIEIRLGSRPKTERAPQAFESVATFSDGCLWFYGDDTEERPGTLFAVYEFLDQALGVTWPFPGDREAFVRPQVPFAPEEGWTIRYAPPLQMTEVRHGDFWKKFTGKYRYAWLRTPEPLRCTKAETRRFSDEFARWLLRQRIASRVRLEYGHAFTDWQRRYLKDHPDWFGLTDNPLLFRADTNNRGLPERHARRAKFCVSNPAVADAIVDDWVKRGAPKYFNICPNDGTPGFCRCENCLKLDARLPGEDFLATLTDRYVWFWNRIAERAVKVRPDVQLISYIYSYYRLPPRRERIEFPDNMIFGVVPSLQDDIDTFFSGWRERGLRHFFLRPNYLGYAAVFHRGYERTIYEVFQKARAIGLMGVDFDGGCAERRQRDLEEYVVARMITHPDLPFETICDEFYAQFGAAAGDVRKVRERIRVRGERSLARDIRGDAKRRILDDSLLGRFAVLAHDEASLAEDLRLLREAREKRSSVLTDDQCRRLDGEIVRAEHSLVTYRFHAAGSGDVPDVEKLRAADAELLAFRLAHKAEIGHAFEGFYDRTSGEDRIREKLGVKRD